MEKLEAMAQRALDAGAKVEWKSTRIIIKLDLVNVFEMMPYRVINQKFSNLFGNFLEMLKIPEFEELVLNVFLNFPHRISVADNCFDGCKIGSKYFARSGWLPVSNSDRTITISLQEWIGVDMVQARLLAGQRLLEEVDSEDLSMAEKWLIMRIGAEVFEYTIEASFRPDGIGASFGLCTATHLNEMAISELSRYGFCMKKMKGFRNVDLKL